MKLSLNLSAFQADLMSVQSVMAERLKIYDFYEHSEFGEYLLPNSWNRNVPRIGRIGVDAMKALLPAPAQDVLILLCGPQGMVHDMYGKENADGVRAFDGSLSKLGYSADMIHLF